MKISEIFKSIQGEGKYTGQPALFIRLSGCTRDCDFCDTKYHKQGKEMTTKEIIKEIKNSGMDYIVWTGGEPMLQEDEIHDVISETSKYCHHLETNGDILPESPRVFSYICFSPKESRVAQNILNYVMQVDNAGWDWDIKIVTDLQTVGYDPILLDKATILMPLTTFKKQLDEDIKQTVWNYCIKHNIKYSPRIHVDVWGNKKRK